MTEQNIKRYKVGDEINTQYVLSDGVTMSPNRYQVGQRIDVYDKETHKRVAAFRVTSEDGVNVKGKIINTYGHKRRK